MGTKNNPGKFDVDLAKIDPDEPVFILRGRDPLASTMVHAWANASEELLGLEATDEDRAKIAEARACAKAMEQFYARYEVKALKQLEEELAKLGEVPE